MLRRISVDQRDLGLGRRDRDVITALNGEYQGRAPGTGFKVFGFLLRRFRQ